MMMMMMMIVLLCRHGDKRELVIDVRSRFDWDFLLEGDLFQAFLEIVPKHQSHMACTYERLVMKNWCLSSSVHKKHNFSIYFRFSIFK